MNKTSALESYREHQKLAFRRMPPGTSPAAVTALKKLKNLIFKSEMAGAGTAAGQQFAGKAQALRRQVPREALQVAQIPSMPGTPGGYRAEMARPFGRAAERRMARVGAAKGRPGYGVPGEVYRSDPQYNWIFNKQRRMGAAQRAATGGPGGGPTPGGGAGLAQAERRASPIRAVDPQVIPLFRRTA